MVYNADSGRWNALSDSLHKLLSPSTYPCSLCRLTHGFFDEKADWSAFKERTGLTLEMLHRDQLISSGIKLPGNGDLPVVLEKSASGDFRILLTAAELNAMRTSEEFLAWLQAFETGAL